MLELLIAALLLGSGSFGAPPSPDPSPAASGPASATSPASGAPAARRDRDEGVFPRLDIYLPEGKFDLRLSRLLKNAFFEGQIKYNFVRGDISAFLRYRYYGYRGIYQLGVFDAVEFEDVDSLDNDFERARGVLVLTEWPRSFAFRTFFLAELEHLTSSKPELRFSNDRTHTFVRASIQRGTPDDPRSNAIVGETRARSEALFTAHRDIGPRGSGVTGAVTYAFDFTGGDFSYLELEAAALRRFALGRRSFLVARVHAGSFPFKETIESEEPLPEEDRYTIPREVLFRLDGRENLKGVSDDRLGTEEVHATAEVFFPWFLNRNRRFLGVDWENFYWVLYSGAGTVGFDTNVYTRFGDYVADVGVGFEASFKLKGYTFFLSGALAQAVTENGSMQAHFSVKSYR